MYRPNADQQPALGASAPFIDRIPGFDDPRLDEPPAVIARATFQILSVPAIGHSGSSTAPPGCMAGAGGALTPQAYFDRIDALTDTAEERRQAVL